MTKVINIKGGASYTVYCGRAGKGQSGYWGNPIIIGKRCPECSEIHKTGGSTLACYRKYLARRMQEPLFLNNLKDLKGKTLACFCVARTWTFGDKGAYCCHAQVLAEVTEGLTDEKDEAWLGSPLTLEELDEILPPNVYKCTICHENYVDAENGIDTCDPCQRNI